MNLIYSDHALGYTSLVNIVKNHNWQEADQLVIFIKCVQGFKLGTSGIEKQIPLVAVWRP